jgi:CheY-like chemotaxis protein
MQQASHQEQRRTRRVCSKGSIRVRHGVEITRGRVVDLAVGGVRVRSEIIALCVGDTVTLELTLDPSPGVVFALRGHVLRSTSESRTFVVRFESIPRAFEDCVNEELQALAESRPRLILIDPTVDHRAPIASGLRTGGCLVTEVATPLEAIVALGQLRFDPTVIAVATTESESVADELCAYLRDDHPAVQVIAIGRSMDTRDMQARVEQLLTPAATR